MADSRNLVLRLLIIARDEASSVFGKIFKALNDSTNVIAGHVRAAFANLFGGAVDSAADFEQQLSKVQSKGDETYQDLGALKGELQKLAAQFGVTGTEAAQGMEVLAAAGLNSTEALKALPPVLNLAKIEGLSLDSAATKLVDSLSIMGLGFDQAGKMADVLAKGANISTASASSLAEALSGAGGQAKAAGMDLETTVAALDMLHKGGIKGSAAGTALSAVLTALQDPTSTASAELNRLGITSRDLGAVLDGLNTAGPRANAAIMAFGETAGPGLRAMMTQGSATLNEFTGQLRHSDGAAQEAANKLQNNLNSALDGLAAAWDSFKSAFAEPVLTPLANAAREVATALNDALNSGALKPVQEAIKTFATQGVQAIREFLASFDFSTVLPAIQEFAASAQQTFSGIANAGQIAADTVKVAWNGVQIAVKSVAITLAGFTAAVLTTAASAVAGLNSMKLASDEVRATVEKMARDSQEGVVRLRDSIVQDGKEMGAAWTRLTTETDTVATAHQRLKTALPEREIAALQERITAYTDALKEAAPGSERAAFFTEQLKLAHKSLSEALGPAATATQKVTQDTQKLAAATQATTKTAGDAVPVAEKYTATWAQSADGIPRLVAAHGQLGGGVAEIARATGAARGAVQDWNGALVTSHEGVTELADGLAPMPAYLTTAAEKTAEYDRQIKAASANTAKWTPGLTINAVQLLGLKDAADTTAARLAYLQSIQKDLPEASAKIATATADANAALNLYTAGLAANVTQQENALEAIRRATTINQNAYDLRIKQAQVEGEIAKLKGDATAALRAENEQVELQIQKTQAASAEKQAEIEQYQNLIDATQQKLQADGQLDAADQAQLKTMQDKLEGLQQEKKALDQSVTSTRQLEAARRSGKDADEDAVKGIDLFTDAKRRNEQVTRQQIKADAEFHANAAAGADLITRILAGWSTRLEALSPVSRKMFDSFIYGTQAATKYLSEMDLKMKEIEDKQRVAYRGMADYGFVKWANTVASKALEIEKNFWAQADAADRLVKKLNDVGNSANTLQQLADQAETAARDFNQLDNTRLDQLANAIETARRKIDELREATVTAQQRLAQLDEELAREQGDNHRADLIRQQIEYEQQLAEIQRHLQQAETAHNNELIRLYQEQIARLNELNALRIRNIENENKKPKPDAKPPPPSKPKSEIKPDSNPKPAVASEPTPAAPVIRQPGSTVVNITIPNARYLDAKAADELARLIKPALDDLNRRLA